MISKKEKENKMREKIKNKMDEQNELIQYVYTYIFGVAGVLISIVGLC